MKIAYICSNFFTVSETFIRDLASGMQEHHDVNVFAKERILHGDPSDNIPVDLYHWSHAPPLPDRVRHRFKQAFGKGNPHYHSTHAAKRLKIALYPLLRRLKPDLLYADYGTVGIHLMDIANELSIPLVVHFHGFDASAAMNNPWYRDQVSRLLKSSAEVIVPSHHMARLLRIACGGQASIHVIPYAPDLALATRLGKSTKSEKPTVAALGRLIPKKNPLALIEAFAIVQKEIPQAHLDLIGDGGERNRVEKRITERGLEQNVTLHGALPHQEALEIVARSWVFAQHSVTAANGDQEGLPVSILEALAMGIPVVSTLHSGIPEAVIDGKNGFLVREHDFVEMAARIVSLLENPRQLPEVNFSVGQSDRLDKILSVLKATSRPLST